MGLAAKQRMNTDVRRSVFSVIVTSVDYEDAFERLMSLNLRYADTHTHTETSEGRTQWEVTGRALG